MSSMDDSPRLPDDSQGGREMAEQRKVADRLWAYSDAVFAVIVTVMVLQLRTPASHHFSSLLGLWPTLISYVASYVFIAIIWINYHYLSRFVETPSLGLVWINFLHLLFVSLIPFTNWGDLRYWSVAADAQNDADGRMPVCVKAPCQHACRGIQ
jgi:uncharacterized membrane protein